MKTVSTYVGFVLCLLLLIGAGCNDFPLPEDEFLKSARSSENAELKKNENKKPAELSTDEIDGLLFMREEEKLAHDVYYQFYQWYAHNIFLNICESEQKHTDAILRLLDFYDLDDPAAGKAIGVFQNTALQDLYNSLVSDGKEGLLSALEVGVLIEETDINDINSLMTETEVKNILQVYSHLLNGSGNHLSSFERVLSKVESKQK
ncbi:DUF2202 domain-containing protein [Maribellus sp. CM-23]|uniref:DUF2202 domain-containing protein n=1 Tax=Maribellus sp. CM-23 TaxID=2781026 RepID=UPI001F4077E5|nr:DUF2202 domain-containing protein [Maribellus sp. CM-23]MCE4562705.1 DUF2202 domain-containing protein [Maribellus sp. CM-23]